MSMDAFSIAVIVLLALAVTALVWNSLLLQRGKAADPVTQLELALNLLKADLIGQQAKSLLDMRGSLDSAHKILNDRLAEGTSTLDRRMSVLGEIENRLGQLATKADNIEEVGKNIQSLSELLRPPNLRGALGEMLLENLIAEILPADSFEMQYRFDDGLRVDAVVKLGDKLLPIDAKFPMDSFQRLSKAPEDETLQKEFSTVFKKMADEIATKYLRPHENTTEFALMYVPSEAVYYQLISQRHRDGFEHALSKRIIPSSPGHLYAFLASVTRLYGELSLAGRSISSQTRQLLAELDKMSETSDRLERFHQKMSGSMRSLAASFDRARSELGNLQTDLARLREPLAQNESETEESTGPAG